MLVALGENAVKTVEDFADCATDDLVGWSERKDGTTTRHKGFLEGFDVSREDAEQMILEARVKAGWIEAPEPQEDEVATEEESAEDGDAVEEVPDAAGKQAG
jgi:N utilization substance protein A